MRWALQLAGVALGLVAVATGAALIALHTTAGRDRLRAAVASRLEGVLGGQARIAGLEGSVFGGLVAHGVELDGPDHQPMLTIQTLRFELALRPLFGRVARLDHVRADDVALTIPRGWRVPALAASRWAVELPDVAVARAHLVVDREPPGSTVELTEIEATGAVLLPAGEAPPTLRTTARVTWCPGGIPGLERGGTATASVARVAQPRTGAWGAWIEATLDGTPVKVGVVGDLDARSVFGLAVAPAIDLGAAAAARGRAAVGFHVVAPDDGARSAWTGRGVVVADGDLAGQPLLGALASVRIAAGTADIDAWLAGAGGRATVAAEVAFSGAAARLARGHATVTADPAWLTGDRLAAAGPVTAELDVTGDLVPAPHVAVHGELDALRPRAAGFAAAKLRAVFDARDLPGRVAATARITATEVRRGAERLGNLVVDLAPAGDRGVAVAVRSIPITSPGAWRIDADGLVRAGEVTRVELGHHHIAGAGQRWDGRGGTIEISARRVVAHALRTSGPGGALELAALSVPRAGTGDVTVVASAAGLDLPAVERVLGVPATWRGAVDARVAVERRAGRWTGTAEATGHQIARDGPAAPVDAHVELALRSSKIAVHGELAGGSLGRAAIALDATPPAQVTDPAAWRRIRRGEIESAQVTLERLDLAALGRLVHADLGTGTVEGELALGAATRGRLRAHGLGLTLRGRPAALDADVALASDDRGDVVATASLMALGITASGRAAISPPEHLLDPSAWRELGVRGVHDAALGVADAPLEAVLAALAIPSPLTGRVTASLSLAAAASGPRFALELRGVHGGLLVPAIDAAITGSLDERGAAVDLTVGSAAHPLVVGHATAPLDLAAIVAHGLGAARDVPLTGCVAVDSTRSASPPDCRAVAPVALESILGVLGRDDATGTLAAAWSLGGSLGAPTVTGTLAAHDVHGKTVTGDPTPVMHDLEITGQWSRHAFEVVASASEAPGHDLRASARGDLAALDRLQLAVEAHQFDLAPLAVFVPGPGAGAGGVVDGTLEQHGLDPEHGMHGQFHIANARMPISPTIGTLQAGALDVAVDHGHVTVKLDARLGGGRVALAGTASLSSADGTSAEATIALHQVSPISASHPVIDAQIAVQLRRADRQWRASIGVRDAQVTVPDRSARELHPVGAPADLVFGDSRAPTPARPQAPPAHRARDPVLVATLDIRPAHVRSPEFRGDVGGTLTAAIGDGLSLAGSLAATRADVDLFSRRYVVDRAAVHFDGSTDPMLDIALSYEFPEVTLYAKIGGRQSKPDVVLSSSPASYTQDQLFGFFLGGAPGGELSKAASATSAAAGAASSMINAVVNRLLPSEIRGDVQLRYETATATSSAAVVVGLWLTRRVFVAGRSRSSPLPVVENGSEGDLEWWLGGNWMFQATFGNRSVGGSDLLWRHHW